MLEICKKLFNSWNDAGLHYCHWKSNEHLQAGLDGLTDLDVLLKEEDKDQGYDILRGLDFLLCRSQYGSRYPGVVDWIGFDESTGSLIHLHLHFRIVTGHKGLKEYSLPWLEDVLRTRIIDSNTNVFVCDPNIEIVTLYSRIGLKANAKQITRAKRGNYEVDKNILREIAYLKSIVNSEKMDAIVHKYFKNKSNEMIQIIKKPELDSESFLELIKITESVMAPFCRYSRNDVFIRKAYYEIALKIRVFLKKKFPYAIISRKTPASRKGLMIAFLGQDGAGKSTVVKAIEKWLSWKLDVNRIYLGSGDDYNPWEKRLQGLFQGQNSIILKPIRAWLVLKLYIKLGCLVLKNLHKAEKYSSKGGIALFDRYPQTAFPGINDGPKIRMKILPLTSNSFLKKVISWYADKEEKNLEKAIKVSPDVVVKLMLRPEESIRRKPENDIDVVKRKNMVIKALAFEKSKVYEINAEQDFNEEIKEIKKLIWRNLIRKNG